MTCKIVKKLAAAMAAVAVAAGLLVGCVEKPDEGDPNDPNNPNSPNYEKPGEGTPNDPNNPNSPNYNGGGLVLGPGEAWVWCEVDDSGRRVCRGLITKSNGEYFWIIWFEDDPTWYFDIEEGGTYSTSGNQLTIIENGGKPMTKTYSISGNTLTVDGIVFTKTSDVHPIRHPSTY